MSSKNQIMKVKGYDANDNTNLCELQRDQPFSKVSDGKHYGMPISTCKFLGMLYRFWRRDKPSASNPFSNVLWVNFSKASLFRILAQEDVEYVRFYFAIPSPDINDASLALEGINSKGNPVKLKQILAVAGTMTGENDKDIEAQGNQIMALTDNNPPADNEEMGNGGPGLVGNIRNISSLNEFMEVLKSEHSISLQNHTFQDFIKAYYMHAQKSFS